MRTAFRLLEFDDHSALDLGLAEKRMPLAAHRDLESLAVGELHELRDVLRIAGPEHGDRLLVHDVSKVVGRRLQHGIIEGQLAFEILQVIAQRLRAGRIIARRLQHEECRSAREPFAEVATRDIPLHGSLPGPVLCLTAAVEPVPAPGANERPCLRAKDLQRLA